MAIGIQTERHQLTALNTRVVVRPLTDDESTPGGILLPESARGLKQEAIVVSIGSKVTDDLQEGDHVVCNRFGATELEINGERLQVFEEENILVKLH